MSASTTAAKMLSSGRYSAAKSTAPLTARIVQPSPSGSRSTATRSAPSASAAASASSAVPGGGSVGSPPAPDGSVRRALPPGGGPPPRARGGPPPHGAEHLPAGDEDADVVADRRHELLHDRAGRDEPELAAD